jgi:transposase-like protein
VDKVRGLWYNNFMRKIKIIEGRLCPKCGSKDNQLNVGFNKSGTQRCQCKECGKYYTLNPKTQAYPEELRELAIKEYLSGVSGRGVGKIHGMSKANVYNWIKKTRRSVDKQSY